MRAVVLLVLISAPMLACTGGAERLPVGLDDVMVQLPGDECRGLCAFDFGEIPLGAERAVAFDVVNLGDAFTRPAVAASNGVELVQDLLPSLAPGEAAPFIVIVNAREPGPIVAEVFVNGSTIQIDVTATVAPVELVFSPNECAFGEVVVGETRACNVVVTNPSSRFDVVIDQVRTSSEAFFVNAGTGVTIAAGSSITLEVTARPPSVGEFDGFVDYAASDRIVVDAVRLSVTGI